MADDPDVTIEDEREEGIEFVSNPKVDQVSGGQLYSNTQLGALVAEGWAFVASYGWYLLLGAVILAFVWYKLKPHYLTWMEKRERRAEERNFDPVREEKYQESMIRAREKMQRAHDVRADEYMQKKEAREAEERDERIRQWEEFKVVGKSKTRPKEQHRAYMPLGGGGGGGGYRPERRTVGGGGGG